MTRIRRLPEPLIDQIAAGEVVERPASIVKELVENSLDAGATTVEVRLDDGGKARILVEDDGSGMTSEDARLAFARHATSKIATFDDLLQVGTLGFRGEALASIASVARVELVTAESNGEGVRVLFEGGREVAFEPAARARGTSIEVSSLFYNVPARREFLKSAASEVRRVNEVLQGYALVRPEIGFEVRHGGRRLLRAARAGTGAEGVRRRVGQIFGEAVAEDLVAMDRAVGPGRAWGFVGGPETVRGRRYFVFVNGRMLRDKAILSTFYRAVRDTWKGDKFPALFLFLDLPPDAVDVNVHPQKAEVRFRDNAIASDLYRALRAALELGLGEGEAPARPLGPLGTASGGELPPLGWQGLGGRYRLRRDPEVGSPAGEVREVTTMPEAHGPGSSGDSLARVSYAPEPPRRVPLSGRSGDDRSLRLLGQYKGTLVLLEGEDGLYIVDQHVAHERILFERLRTELAREVPKSQRLLDSVLLELAPAESARLEELAAELEESGFELSFLHDGSVAVAAVPVVLKPREAEALLMRLAASSPSGQGTVAEQILDALAASMACKRAVKMHEALSVDEMEAMIAELFGTDSPFACPHGRPTILKMSDADLESRFGRR